MEGITINCDMGEAFGIYSLGDDEACMPYITHANIACGFHASDPMVMWKTVRAAKAAGVAVGAHPGFPDKEGFGRREMRLSRKEAAAIVLYQAGALNAFLEAEGMKLSHIKPHGAFYGMAQKDPQLCEGIADAAEALQVPVIAYSDCAMSEVYERRGIEFVCEFYSDLDYDDEGQQLITKTHDSVSVDKTVTKVLRAIEEGVTQSVNGNDVKVTAQTICIHSDTPNAVDIAKAVHEALKPHLTA